MNAIETAVRVIVDLLVRGQYVTVEKVTRGRRLTANQISSAISAYGRTLVSPGDDWWSTLKITPIDISERAAFHVAAPLWAREEGRSDLTLEMILCESPLRVWDSEILNIHVL
jgi:hypothetical protein